MSASCLFCSIIDGSEPSRKVYESEDFLVIHNKFPKAPVHVLILDKQHREKQNTLAGKFSTEGYWDKMFMSIYETIKLLGLDKTGYKLVNNGAGYNHFEHEHFHLLGGSKSEPVGET